MLDTFNGGYTQALLDVQRYFEEHSESMKRNRMFSAPYIMAILQTLIDNRNEMRETGTVENLIVNVKAKTVKKGKRCAR